MNSKPRHIHLEQHVAGKPNVGSDSIRDFCLRLNLPSWKTHSAPDGQSIPAYAQFTLHGFSPGFPLANRFWSSLPKVLDQSQISAQALCVNCSKMQANRCIPDTSQMSIRLNININQHNNFSFYSLFYHCKSAHKHLGALVSGRHPFLEHINLSCTWYVTSHMYFQTKHTPQVFLLVKDLVAGQSCSDNHFKTHNFKTLSCVV